MGLRFAFLLLEDHPYGREMLSILLGRGFVPRLVIQERSPLAAQERVKFLERIAGQQEPPSVDELVAGLDVPLAFVQSHNSAQCHQLLTELAPELLVLGGTRIIQASILSIPTLGTLNAHPGLLPGLRGSSSVGWALFLDLPVGSTVHLVDEGIDTGAILLQRRLSVRRRDTYEKLVRRVLTLSGELMAEVLATMEVGELRPSPQDPRDGRTFRVIPPGLLLLAREKLATGAYGHFDG